MTPFRLLNILSKKEAAQIYQFMMKWLYKKFNLNVHTGTASSKDTKYLENHIKVEHVVDKSFKCPDSTEYSWLTITYPCMFTKSISIVSHLVIVIQTCLVMKKWLEFITRCALLPVMAIVSVLVNSDPKYCNGWLPKAFMNLKIILW